VLPRQQVVRRAVGGDSSETYLLYLPSAMRPGARVFVDVHGISRNVEQHATLFAPYAEQYGVILVAPCFTREAHAGYQWLEGERGGRRADLDLDAMLEDVASLTGADIRQCYLFGFSGGAQFVHRYALAHPERVARVVIGAAGWYTFPDSAVPYPYGLGPSGARADLRFDPDRFLRVPMAVLVGGDDAGVESLRRNPDLDRQQGTVRRERARTWVAAMRQAATTRGLPPLVTCEEVPGIRHSFEEFMREGGLGGRVFAALFGPPVTERPPPEAQTLGEPRAGSR